MSELMLINPGRSLKARRVRKKRNTVKGYYPNPAKKKRRRPMTALQLKYFGKKSQRNPVMAKKRRTKKRKHTARRAVAITVRANPHRRTRRHNPIRMHKRRHHRRSRNPIAGFNLNSFLKQTLIPSAVGAAGALGVNIVLSYLPIPPNLKTGPVGTLVKIAGAIGVGMVAGMVTNRRVGEQVTAGAVTVELYQLMASMMATNAPALAAKAGLSGYEDYPSLGYAGAGEGVGMYPDLGMYVGSSQRVSSI